MSWLMLCNTCVMTIVRYETKRLWWDCNGRSSKHLMFPNTSAAMIKRCAKSNPSRNYGDEKKFHREKWKTSNFANLVFDNIFRYMTICLYHKYNEGGILDDSLDSTENNAKMTEVWTRDRIFHRFQVENRCGGDISVSGRYASGKCEKAVSGNHGVLILDEIDGVEDTVGLKDVGDGDKSGNA
ncbi:Hypothetical predicted protein [Octopus vulgaris]|uniref:Uncharacterized protein n=1 Tax=Octopus vulgaris TaxID=6645 RepID=A0AA36B0A4_OCTVU|nr:Hypothetical predicted protein [Octopus vulgaris]